MLRRLSPSATATKAAAMLASYEPRWPRSGTGTISTADYSCHCNPLMNLGNSSSSYSSSTQQYRFQSTDGGDKTKTPPPPPPKSPLDGNYTGVIELTASNLRKELLSPVPTLIYFHVTNHPEVAKFTKELCEQVTIANRDHKMAARSYEATGEDRDLAVRVAAVDCMKEVALAQQFNLDPHHFPMILFMYGGQIVDRLVGIIGEAQIKDAITAMIAYAQQEVAAKQAAAGGAKGSTSPDKVNRVDNDDENIMTLIQAAQNKIKNNDVMKGEQLYNKAVRIGREKIVELKKQLHLDKKKMTPELLSKLKQDPHYHGLAQALAGTALLKCSQKRLDDAGAIAEEIRSDFPSAMKELRDVADAVVRIDLLRTTSFDLENDNYVTLMKREDLLNDPVAFYNTQVKLAVAHMFEKRSQAAIDECLRVIRAEPKLLGPLKRAGIIAPDASLSSKDSTPARRVLFLIFEALGNNSKEVIDARKKLTAYLSL